MTQNQHFEACFAAEKSQLLRFLNQTLTPAHLNSNSSLIRHFTAKREDAGKQVNTNQGRQNSHFIRHGNTLFHVNVSLKCIFPCFCLS